MASIDDLFKDETVQTLVSDVRTRFVANKQPTPQPRFYKELAGRRDTFGDLLRYEFVQQISGKLVPGFLAFANAGEDSAERGSQERFAKKGLDGVLRTLAKGAPLALNG